MANKRMFTMKIVDSDAFLDMPLSTQCLYFHLNMRADDDGFVGNPKKVMRIVGASDDDLKLLIAKKFVLTFENGVIVIKHWRMHNTLSKQRYQETVYKDEKSMLLLKDNKSYSLTSGKPIDDSHLIEMFDGNRTEKETENIWRTFGEQMETPDIEVVVEEGIGLDKDLDRDIESRSIENPDAPFINLPLQGGKFYTVTYGYLDEMKAIYPGLDIEQCIRNMLGWLKAKPDRLKTQRGIKSFINNWLQKDHKDLSNGSYNNRSSQSSKEQEMKAAMERAAQRDAMRGEGYDEQGIFPID